MGLKTAIIKLDLRLTRAFWVDRNFKKFKKEDIDDEYLKNICYFIARGGGWYAFIHNEKRIFKIFEEAYRRKILRPDILLNLHCWTLFAQGYKNNMPKYFGEPTKEQLEELEKSIAL